MRSLLAFTALLLVALLLGSTPARSDVPLTAPDVDALLRPMASAEQGARDATYILHRQEYVDGALQPEQRMAIKWRRPYDVYLRWVGDVHNGREVLWSPGLNEGQVYVSVSSTVPTLTFDPDSSVLKRGQRHGLRDVGPSFPVRLVLADLKRAREHPELPSRAVDLGQRTVWGEPSRCFHAWMPKSQDPAFYAQEAEVCISNRLHLPSSFKVWDTVDGRLQLVEAFVFEGMKINVGLTDQDFSPEFPDYGF